MRCRIVQRVPQVVQERVALPSKACLNVTVRETLAVQEVARRDANGVSREASEGAVTRLELENRHGGSLEEDGNLVVCDEAVGATRLSGLFCIQEKKKTTSEPLLIGSNPLYQAIIW